MKKKKKPKAPWTRAFPNQVRKSTKQSVREEFDAYREEARAFVETAIASNECCPVMFKVHRIVAEPNQVHHKRGRGRGGRGPLLRDKRHWLAVSQQGHDFIHANIEYSRGMGWICAKGLWNVPDRTNAS